MFDVFLAAGEIVVEADDIMALGDEALAEMGTEEAGAAGDKNAFHCNILSILNNAECGVRNAELTSTAVILTLILTFIPHSAFRIPH
jgi:hypothetical protein